MEKPTSILLAISARNGRSIQAKWTSFGLRAGGISGRSFSDGTSWRTVTSVNPCNRCGGSRSILSLEKPASHSPAQRGSSWSSDSADRLDAEVRRVFTAHVRRFAHNTPSCLEDFLGFQPDTLPCPNVTVAVYEGQRLLAASFLDLGRTPSRAFTLSSTLRSRGGVLEFHHAQGNGARPGTGLPLLLPGLCVP